MKVEPFGPLDPALYRDIVRRALTEDLSQGDITTAAIVTSEERSVGSIVVGSPCVLAGLDVAVEAFAQLDPRIEVVFPRQDSDHCSVGETVLRLSGLGIALLTAERTALNFLQRMSGIATLTRQFVDVAKGRTIVLDTRKTTPTLRALEKYAVRAGGGVNHRMALDDGILIKDNHIRMVGSIQEAVECVRRAGHDIAIEVEVQSLSDVSDALAAGADVLLADNMSTADIHETVRLARGVAKVEVSGGVTMERLEKILEAGPEFVSVGALTHSAIAVDFSFDLRPEGDLLELAPPDSLAIS